MKMRKFLSVLLAVFMALALVPAAVLAEDKNVTITQEIPETLAQNVPGVATFTFKNITNTEQTVVANIRFQETNEDHSLTLSTFKIGDVYVKIAQIEAWVVKAGETEPSAGPWKEGDRFLGYNIKGVKIPANGEVVIQANVIASAAKEYKFKALTNCASEGVSDSSSTADMTVTADQASEDAVAAIGENKYQKLSYAFAAASGRSATIKMLCDYELDTMIIMRENGTDITLDMNGKTITAKKNVKDFVDNCIFKVGSGSSLVITGNGTFDLEDNYTYQLISPGGDVIIENGRFIKDYSPEAVNSEDVVTSRKGTGLYGDASVFVGVGWGRGKLIILDGYFAGFYKENSYLNSYTNLNGSWGQYINIQGGTFVGQNPAYGDQNAAKITPQECQRPQTYCQTVFLEGQGCEDMALPYMYKITEGRLADGRPTYTVSVKYDIKPAPLHDCATDNPIPDEDLAKKYDVFADGNNITISAYDVQEHINGARTPGKWVGFSVKAPENANGYKMQFGDGSELSETLPLEQNVDGNGAKGVAFYFDADSLKANPRQVALQWQYPQNGVKLSDGNAWPEDHPYKESKPGLTNVYNVNFEEPKHNAPGIEKWIIDEDPIICFGDTFRSGGTFVSIVVGDNEMEDKVLTTKDRFAFEGDHSTDKLIASFLANNPDAEGHNEHQWGYKAEVVPGHPHCLRIVPAEPAEGEEAKPHITADGCEIVGMGGHDRIFMPLSHRVKHYDAQPGDTVTFELKSNVPDYLGDYVCPDNPWPPVVLPAEPDHPDGLYQMEGRGNYWLTFHDVLDTAMTYTDNVVVTLNIEGRETPITLAANEDYTLVYPVEGENADGCTFHVKMDLVAICAKYNVTPEEIESSPEIIVTYTAKVNNGTTHGAYPNKAWVTYEDKESEKPEVYVHVYAIDVLKYDQNNEQTPLSGAEFVLFKDKDKTQIATWTLFPVENPVYYKFKEWVATPEGNSPEYEEAMIFTSGENGKINLEDLLPGTYWLKETRAPDGYIMSDMLLEVTIAATESTDTEAHIVHTKFANSNIPHTGGPGTVIFRVVGAILFIAALAFLIFWFAKRKEENKDEEENDEENDGESCKYRL